MLNDSISAKTKMVPTVSPSLIRMQGQTLLNKVGLIQTQWVLRIGNHRVIASFGAISRPIVIQVVDGTLPLVLLAGPMAVGMGSILYPLMVVAIEMMLLELLGR